MPLAADNHQTGPAIPEGMTLPHDARDCVVVIATDHMQGERFVGHVDANRGKMLPVQRRWRLLIGHRAHQQALNAARPKHLTEPARRHALVMEPELLDLIPEFARPGQGTFAHQPTAKRATRPDGRGR